MPAQMFLQGQDSGWLAVDRNERLDDDRALSVATHRD